MYTNKSVYVSFTSTLLIVDPTAEEEDLATGTVTIVTDEEGRLCSVHKPGTCKFTTKKPMEMMMLAQEKIMYLLFFVRCGCFMITVSSWLVIKLPAL